MHEKICDINNSFWKAYKGFLNDHDIPKWQKKVSEIQKKYEGDSIFYPFCTNLAITWVPIINKIKQEVS